MLAYLLHTLLDWLDERFMHLRELIACRRRLFDDMRALTTYCHFPSWSAMIEFMILGLTEGQQTPPALPEPKLRIAGSALAGKTSP